MIFSLNSFWDYIDFICIVIGVGSSFSFCSDIYYGSCLFFEIEVFNVVCYFYKNWYNFIGYMDIYVYS